MNLGVGEIALLLVLALVLFGAKRLPQVGRAAGDAIREFKAALYGRNRREDEPNGEESGKGEDSGNVVKGDDHKQAGDI